MEYKVRLDRKSMAILTKTLVSIEIFIYILLGNIENYPFGGIWKDYYNLILFSVLFVIFLIYIQSLKRAFTAYVYNGKLIIKPFIKLLGIKIGLGDIRKVSLGMDTELLAPLKMKRFFQLKFKEKNIFPKQGIFIEKNNGRFFVLVEEDPGMARMLLEEIKSNGLPEGAYIK